MTTAETVRALRARWRVLVTVILLCLLGGSAITLATQKTYSATASLFVSVALPKDTGALAATNTFVTARVQSYVSLVATPAVTDQVVRDLDLPVSSRALAAHISADAPLNRVLVNVHADDSSPVEAARIANAVANRLAGVVSGLEQTAATNSSPIRLTVVQPATPPSAPVRPRVLLNLTLALLAGLLLGCGAARLRDTYDDPVRGLAHLRSASSSPVLGVLPNSSRRRKRSARSLDKRALALLAENLEYLGNQSEPRVLEITSLLPGEGKTFVTLELGRALSAKGTTACLLDLDLRSPDLTARLGLATRHGFTSAVRGLDRPGSILSELGKDFCALGSGPHPPNPEELLRLPKAREIVIELSQSFRYTLLDTPALGADEDGRHNSGLAAGAIIVISTSHRAMRRQVARAVRELDAAGLPVVGTVLNNASGRDVKAFLEEFGQGPSTGARSLATSGSAHRAHSPAAGAGRRQAGILTTVQRMMNSVRTLGTRVS